jgi:hypothetical protein
MGCENGDLGEVVVAGFAPSAEAEWPSAIRIVGSLDGSSPEMDRVLRIS